MTSEIELTCGPDSLKLKNQSCEQLILFLLYY